MTRIASRQAGLRARLGLSVAGVSLAVMLVLLLSGFVDGIDQQVGRFADRTPGEIVVQQGEVLTWIGEPLEGVPWIQKAMKLNPFHPPRFWNHLGRAWFVARRYPEAAEAFKRITAPDQFHHAFLAAIYAQLGDAGLASRHVKEVLSLNPAFTWKDTLAPVLHYKLDRDLEHHRESALKSGLPA